MYQDREGGFEDWRPNSRGIKLDARATTEIGRRKEDGNLSCQL